MPVIELRFPAHRYHATPWGHHVNEGLVEWPPSPWRILRALVATYFLKARDDANSSTMLGLVEKLASVKPRYALPAISLAHTRHYMRLYQPGKTAKIFDAFARLDDQARMEVSWEGATLTEEERILLAILVERLGYLGRAESWVEGRLLDASNLDVNVLPMASAHEGAGQEYELVRVLAPMDPSGYAKWRLHKVEEHVGDELQLKRERLVSKGKEPAAAKLSPKDRSRIEAGLPADILEVLMGDTGPLQRQGWSQPPGTQWVQYARPTALLRSQPRSRQRSLGRLPTVARFAVASQVPPLLTHAVEFAHRLRRRLIKLSDGAPVFTGREDGGELLRGHQHCYILCESAAASGVIDHVTLFAPMGFDEQARRTLESLASLSARNGHDIQFVFLQVAEAGELAAATPEVTRLFGPSRLWISSTPFVPTRHPKARRNGTWRRDERGLVIGSPEHDLRRLLAEAEQPEPAKMEAIDSIVIRGRPTSWRSFVTRRPAGGGRRAHIGGRGFRLEFSEPVAGPLALGYGAHFGLGTFVAQST